MFLFFITLKKNWKYTDSFFSDTGVYFANILRKTLTRADPKSVKMTIQVTSHFVLLQSMRVKTVHKHVGEMNPIERLYHHYHVVIWRCKIWTHDLPIVAGAGCLTSAPTLLSQREFFEGPFNTFYATSF